jgi:hypothetical protein
MLLHVPQMVTFWEIHVFFQLRWICLFGTKWAFLHLEKYDLHEIFLWKSNSVLTGNRVLVFTDCNFHLLFGEIHVFLQLSWVGLFGANKAYLHFEIAKWQEILLSKTNSILKGKQCSRSPDSNTNGFLLRDKCVHSTQLNRPKWHLEN